MNPFLWLALKCTLRSILHFEAVNFVLCRVLKAWSAFNIAKEIYKN